MSRIKIVGMNHQHPKHPVVENEIVRFVHEPDNVADKNAVMVVNSHNEKIGYVATKNTLSPGNRKRGCIDNIELLKIDSSKGIIDKVFKTFGYANIQ